MATIINLNSTTPAAPSGNANVKWQFDASSPLNASAYYPLLAGASGDVQVNDGTGVAHADTTFNYNFGSQILNLRNSVAATSGAQNQNSATLEFGASTWNGSSAAASDYTLQAVCTEAGTVGASSILTLSGSTEFQITCGVSITGSVLATGLYQFYGTNQTAAGGAYTVTSVANASAGTTVYTGTFTAGFGNPVAGNWLKIAGFTNPANNGTFMVTVVGPTTVTLANPSGVAESHAATATTFASYAQGDGNEDPGTIQFLGTGQGTSFQLKGTAYFCNAGFLPSQSGPTVAIGLGRGGDGEDFTVIDTFSDPTTKNHGFQVQAIYDGTGTNPSALLMAVISGVPTLNFLLPDTETGIIATGTNYTKATSVGNIVVGANVGDGTNVNKLTIDGTNAAAFNCLLSVAGSFILPNSHTPSSASDTGTQGTIAWDSSFIYVCVATNTWKRVGIATW